MKINVGFIGLGLMGNPMAKNILKAGFPLFVYNRTTSKTKELKKLGAIVTKSPAELASKVDVIITMITGPKDVKQVLFGEKGVVKGAKKGLIVIDMSTIGRKMAKEIGAKLGKKDIHFLDAPVTGSRPKAISGELTILVGGTESVYKKVKLILAAMGKSIHYIGETGSGQAVKLVNNYIAAASIIALCEGMILADTMRVPRQKIVEALSGAPSISATLTMLMPNYANNKFPLIFSLANMEKDLALALLEKNKNSRKLPLLQIAQNLYKKATKAGYGAKDFSSIIKIIDSS